MNKPLNDGLDRKVDSWFTISSLFLVLLVGGLIYKEMNPPYRVYQDEAYLALALAEESAGNSELAAYYRGEAEGKPPRGIRQLFLASGEVERCGSCHVDDSGLESWHLENVNPRFPTSFFGCTVCHGGDRMALEIHRAHHGLKKSVAEMEAPLWDSHSENAAAIISFWNRLREVSPPLSNPLAESQPDYRDVSITGKPMGTFGVAVCLSCHARSTGLTEHIYSERTWDHIDRWSESKFESFRVVEKEPDYLTPPAEILLARGLSEEAYRANCKGCHTTGYDSATDTYRDGGVTCEACHGPGEVFAGLMMRGTVPTKTGPHSFQGEGALVARISADRNVCITCHNPNRHELRPTEGERGEHARLASRRYEAMNHLEPLPPLEGAILGPAQGYESEELFEAQDLEAVGQAIAEKAGCLACHSITGIRVVGPTWKGLYGSERILSDGTVVVADEQYMLESILEPMAKVAQGYFAGMMPGGFEKTLSEEDLQAIIAYMKSLQ